MRLFYLPFDHLISEMCRSAQMKIEQCEPESAFLDDISKLVSFVNMYNNTIPEYIRVARMYLFGTPIRRTGATFRHATPGCVPFHVVRRMVAHFADGVN